MSVFVRNRIPIVVEQVLIFFHPSWSTVVITFDRNSCPPRPLKKPCSMISCVEREDVTPAKGAGSQWSPWITRILQISGPILTLSVAHIVRDKFWFFYHRRKNGSWRGTAYDDALRILEHHGSYCYSWFYKYIIQDNSKMKQQMHLMRAGGLSRCSRSYFV